MKKKLTSILLALVLAIGLLPVKVSAYSVLSGMHGTDFADGELANRLETVFYSGISGCVTPSIPAIGGSLNNSQAYTTTYANQSGSSTDWQCLAYARAAYSYLFGYNVGSAMYQTTFNNVVSGKNSVSYDLFQQLGIKCGAYMRTTISPSGAWDPANGHSIIILGYNSSGITTLEGNYNGAGKIGILNYSWDDFNTRQLRGRNRYICGLAQPTPSIYASLNSSGSGNSGNPGSSVSVTSYFDCRVRIRCFEGQVVNLYNNPGDSVRADYFSLGQSPYSNYGVKLSDGSTWYQISAFSQGVDKTFWLKYESGKMTIEDIPKSYTVNFNANGGSSSSVSQIVYEGETYGDLPTPPPPG